MRKFRKSEILLIDEATGQTKPLVDFNYQLAFPAQWLQSKASPWFWDMGWAPRGVVPAVEVVPTRPPLPEGELGELIREEGFTPTAIAYVGTNPTRRVLIFVRPLDDGAQPIQLFHDRAPGIRLVLDPVPGFKKD